jgi:hypothetical protein
MTSRERVAARCRAARGRRGPPRPRRWLGRSPEHQRCWSRRPPAGSSPRARAASPAARLLGGVEKRAVDGDVDATRLRAAATAARWRRRLRRACQWVWEGAAAVSQWVRGHAAAAQARRRAHRAALQCREARSRMRAERACGWRSGAARTGSRPCAPGSASSRRPRGTTWRGRRARSPLWTGDLRPARGARRWVSRETRTRAIRVAEARARRVRAPRRVVSARGAVRTRTLPSHAVHAVVAASCAKGTAHDVRAMSHSHSVLVCFRAG